MPQGHVAEACCTYHPPIIISQPIVLIKIIGVIWKKRIRQKEQLDEGEDADKRGDRKMESNHSPGIPDRVAEREMESSDSPGIPHRMMAGWGVGGVTSDILSLLSVPPVSITSANRATKPGHRPWSWISDLNLTPCKKMPLLEVL